MSSEKCDRYRRTPVDVDKIHGNQEGKHFRKYYDSHCDLPLYIFCNEHPLCAALERFSIDPAKGSVEQLEYITSRLRARWPRVQILVRADSGFCRDYIMNWCGNNGIDYIIGLARNERLTRMMDCQLNSARKKHEETCREARFGYGALQG